MHGLKQRRYVGPVDDADITRRVEHFKDLKADVRARRRLVATLARDASLPRPDRFAGDFVEALAGAGFFRLRGVLVGSIAYQTYPAILGVRLPGAALHTGDADVAQFRSISVAVGDQMPPVLPLLRALDDTFRAIPHVADGRQAMRFVARTGYRVEILTSNQGSAERDGHPMPIPALGGASAEPLRLLDCLIHAPVRATLLHAAGVAVLVPAPERYAIHKLIVATRRRGGVAATARQSPRKICCRRRH